MYSCTLNIKIFSLNEQIATIISHVSPLPGFQHCIEKLQTPEPEVANANIIVLNLSTKPNLPALRRKACPNAIIVLCHHAANLEELTPEDYAAIDAVWPEPLAPAFVEHAFRRILNDIKLRTDSRLTQIYLDTAMNSMPDLVWFKDIRGAHLKVNSSFCAAVGKTKEDIEGRGHYYIWGLEPEDYAAGEYVCLETEEEVLRQRKTCLFDEKVLSKQGLRQFKTYKTPLFFDDGQLMGTVGVAQDVTDLANRGAELEIILRNLPFGLAVCDATGHIINANARFEDYFGQPVKQLEGVLYATWRSSLQPVHSARHEDFLEVLTFYNNCHRHVEIHEVPILDVFGNYVGQFSICRDVTIERAYEKQMHINANTDALTGLYNRRYFYEYVEKTRGDQRISLLYIDLDNFKQVNDKYGHKVGDDALNFMADLLRFSFPKAMPVRLGGDEFVVCILGSCTLAELEEKATQMLHACQESFLSNECLVHVNISIGITITDDTTLSLDELVRRGDDAMYQAKRLGKARYCIYNENETL